MVGTALTRLCPSYESRNDARLQIHHHVVAFDRHGERLRHVRPLHHTRSRLDIDRIGPCAKALRVAIGLPGTDIKLPAMPGAADDFAEFCVCDLAGIWGLRAPDQRTFAP